MNSLKRYFLAGLFFLIPAVVSVWILIQVFMFVDNIIGDIVRSRLPQEYVRGIGFLTVVLIILAIGFVAESLIGRRLLRSVDRLFNTVPVLNRLYNFLKGILDNITRLRESRFQGVARVKFVGDSTTIGFITADLRSAGRDCFGIFVPTVPNPTTGFYLIVPKEQVEILDISVEEGLKLIVSAGIYQPAVKYGGDKD